MRRYWSLPVLLLLLTVSVAGCSSRDASPTVSPMASPAATPAPSNVLEEGAQDVGRAAKRAVDGAGDLVRDAADGVGDAARDVGNGRKQAVQ